MQNKKTRRGSAICTARYSRPLMRTGIPVLSSDSVEPQDDSQSCQRFRSAGRPGESLLLLPRQEDPIVGGHGEHVAYRNPAKMPHGLLGREIDLILHERHESKNVSFVL